MASPFPAARHIQNSLSGSVLSLPLTNLLFSRLEQVQPSEYSYA